MGVTGRRWPVIALLLALASCTKNYTAQQLAGSYALTSDNGIGTIRLNADGTYRHVFKPKGGPEDSQDGTWKLETLTAGPTVVLNGFQPLHGEKTHGQGIYLLGVASSFGHTYLITNIDTKEGYEKQS